MRQRVSRLIPKSERLPSLVRRERRPTRSSLEWPRHLRVKSQPPLSRPSLGVPKGKYWETWMKFVRDDMFKLGYLSPDDFSLFKLCHSVSEAVNEIVQFYKNYHSVRWVGRELVLRICRRLPDKAMVDINKKFA